MTVCFSVNNVKTLNKTWTQYLPPHTNQTIGHLIEFRLLKFSYAFDRNDNFSHYLHYFPCIKTIADQPQQFASTSIRHQAHELKDDGM